MSGYFLQESAAAAGKADTAIIETDAVYLLDLLLTWVLPCLTCLTLWW